jgi:hypothetical protein
VMMMWQCFWSNLDRERSLLQREYSTNVIETADLLHSTLLPAGCGREYYHLHKLRHPKQDVQG